MKIKTTELSYQFSVPNWSFGDKHIFDATTLTLQKSKWTGLLGRSGCGKSTLLRLMVGLLEATTLEENNVKLTYMAQQDGLLPWATIFDNVLLPQKFHNKPDHAKAHHLISEIGLEDFKYEKPHILSQGMRQRVALARTLMTNAEIILLDEPFSALDCFTRHEMHQLTKKFFTNKTVLLVTHDPDEAAKLCDMTYLMRRGEIQPYQLDENPEHRIEILMEDLNA